PAAPLHPVGCRLSEGEQALVVGVAMVGRIAGGLGEPRHDVRGRWRVRIADAEIDDVHAAREELLLHPVYRSEEVRRKALDSLGFFDLNRLRAPAAVSLLAETGGFYKRRFFTAPGRRASSTRQSVARRPSAPRAARRAP